jgi:hypothetical protein
MTVKSFRSFIIPLLALSFGIYMLWHLTAGGEKPDLSAAPVGGTQVGSNQRAAVAEAGGSTRAVSGQGAEKQAVPEAKQLQAGKKARARAIIKADPVRADELASFEPVRYSEGQPHYAGEPVTAYVRVGSSGRQAALTVSQGGEYPQLLTEPGEEVQIRLAFTQTPPDSPIALTAQDGGRLLVKLPDAVSPADPTLSTVGVLDAQRQLGFAFRVSNNPGIHRVTIGSPTGETKVLEFWAGPPPQLKQLTPEIERIGK